MIDFTLVCHSSRKRKDGTSQIFIKAVKAGQSAQIGTNIYILPEQWQNGRVVEHPNAQALNTEITRQLFQLQSWALDQLRKNQRLPLSALHNYKKRPKVFYQFVLSCAETDHSVSWGTIKRYRVVAGHLKEFDKDATIDQVDFNFLERFDAYLCSKKLNNNTRISVFKAVQKFLNYASSLGLIDNRDVPKYSNKIREIDSDRCALTEKEVARIECLEFEQANMHLEKIRDMFLFSCYTGLRFSDLQSLTARNFREGEDGLELHFRAQKTGKLLTLPLEVIFDSKPAEIIKKYFVAIKSGKELENPIFAQITNQYANRSIREIALLAQIFKKVTMHVARHTFGTSLATKVPTKILQELLQHSKIETTMVYVHLSNEHINKELKNAFIKQKF